MGISIRAYAKRRGVSDTAVHKAIHSGRITAEPDGTIDPAKADTAWQSNTNPAHQHKPDPEKPVPVPVSTKPAHPVAPASQPTQRPVADADSVLAPGGGAPNYQLARAVKETLNARMVRLDLDERLKKLIKAEDVDADAFEYGRRVRDRIQAVPRRMAQLLASETDPDVIERLLDEELRIALEALSR